MCNAAHLFAKKKSLNEYLVDGKRNSIFWVARSGLDLERSVKFILSNIALSVKEKMEYDDDD